MQSSELRQRGSLWHAYRPSDQAGEFEATAPGARHRADARGLAQKAGMGFDVGLYLARGRTPTVRRSLSEVAEVHGRQVRGNPSLCAAKRTQPPEGGAAAGTCTATPAGVPCQKRHGALTHLQLSGQTRPPREAQERLCGAPAARAQWASAASKSTAGAAYGWTHNMGRRDGRRGGVHDEICAPAGSECGRSMA